ncbi:MAG: transporter permease [Rubritepida sp.]|nr:transporter permease [Rubritepida sp.]
MSTTSVLVTDPARELPLAKRRRPRTAGDWLLAVPGLALLLIAMIAPLIWFLWDSIADIGTSADIFANVIETVSDIIILDAAYYTAATSLVVTLICVVLAYPMAAALTLARGMFFNLLIGAIIVPYFTSTIVRTYAWMVLLGRGGIINQAMLDLGAIDAPMQLLYTHGAVILGMTYVLLPYMVLTIFTAMKAIDPRLLQAAQSMGSPGWYTFLRVYAPLTMPGVMSGSIIVFILSTGFFVTPALMGGKDDVMIGNLIQSEVEINLNWGLASIISIFALVFILALYWTYYRIANIGALIDQEDSR